MSGNVFEWNNDWLGTPSTGYGYGDGSSQTNPAGPASGQFRAMRGGDWAATANLATVSSRGGDYPEDTYYMLGFRLARSDG